MSEKNKQINAENIETLTENSSENLVENEDEVNEAENATTTGDQPAKNPINLIYKDSAGKEITLNPFWLYSFKDDPDYQALVQSYRNIDDLKVPNLIDKGLKDSEGNFFIDDKLKPMLDPAKYGVCCAPHNMNGFLKDSVEGVALWGKDSYANNCLYYNDPEGNLRPPGSAVWKFSTANNFENLNSDMILNITNPNYFPISAHIQSRSGQLFDDYEDISMLKILTEGINLFGCFYDFPSNTNKNNSIQTSYAYKIDWISAKVSTADVNKSIGLAFYYYTLKGTSTAGTPQYDENIVFQYNTSSQFTINCRQPSGSAEIELPANVHHVAFRQYYNGSTSITDSSADKGISDANHVDNIILTLTPIIKNIKINAKSVEKIDLKNYMFASSITLADLYISGASTYFCDKLKLDLDAKIYHLDNSSLTVTVYRPPKITCSINQATGKLNIFIKGGYSTWNSLGYSLHVKNIDTEVEYKYALTATTMTLDELDATKNTFYIWLEYENTSINPEKVFYPSNIIKTKKVQSEWQQIIYDYKRTKIYGDLYLPEDSNINITKGQQISLACYNFGPNTNAPGGFSFSLSDESGKNTQYINSPAAFQTKGNVGATSRTGGFIYPEASSTPFIANANYTKLWVKPFTAAGGEGATSWDLVILNKLVYTEGI